MTHVYEVANKSTSILFSTREAADTFVSSMPGSVGGGFVVSERLVNGAVSGISWDLLLAVLLCASGFPLGA